MAKKTVQQGQYPIWVMQAATQAFDVALHYARMALQLEREQRLYSVVKDLRDSAIQEIAYEIEHATVMRQDIVS